MPLTKCSAMHAGHRTGTWVFLGDPSGRSSSICCWTFMPVRGHLNRIWRSMARACAQWRAREIAVNYLRAPLQRTPLGRSSDCKSYGLANMPPAWPVALVSYRPTRGRDRVHRIGITARADITLHCIIVRHSRQRLVARRTQPPARKQRSLGIFPAGRSVSPSAAQVQPMYSSANCTYG